MPMFAVNHPNTLPWVSGSQRALEASAPAGPFGILCIRIQGFDLDPIESVESGRSDAACGVPSLCLDAAETIGVANTCASERGCGILRRCTGSTRQRRGNFNW